MYCYIDSNNRMLSKQCSTTAASKVEDEYDHISCIYNDCYNILKYQLKYQYHISINMDSSDTFIKMRCLGPLN
jgi:hypothetical protein